MTFQLPLVAPPHLANCFLFLLNVTHRFDTAALTKVKQNHVGWKSKMRVERRMTFSFVTLRHFILV